MVSKLRNTFVSGAAYYLLLIFAACKPNDTVKNIESTMLVELDVCIDTIPQFLGKYYTLGGYYDADLGTVVNMLNLDKINKHIISFAPNSNQILDTLNFKNFLLAKHFATNGDVYDYNKWLDKNIVTTVVLADANDLYTDHVVKYDIENDSFIVKQALGDDTQHLFPNVFHKMTAVAPPCFDYPNKIVGLFLDQNHVEKTDCHNWKIGYINTADTTLFLEDDIQFPDPYPNGNFQWIRNYQLAYNHDDLILLSTSLSSKIRIVKLENNGFRHVQDVHVKSYYHMNIPPPPSDLPDGGINYDGIDELWTTAFYYNSILYNPLDNLYYRFYSKNLPLEKEDGVFNTRNDKQMGVMVFDETFKVIGEFLFAPGMHGLAPQTILLPDGIMVLANYGENPRLSYIIKPKK